MNFIVCSNSEDFFVKLSVLGYISPIPNYIEEFLDPLIFINQYPKRVFCSNNTYFILTHLKYLREIYLIREL